MKVSLYPYQTVLAAQVLNEFKVGRSNVVLAAACGAGKTITSIAICEELLKKNPSLRILVLTHGQVILRTQFMGDIIEQQPDFTYTVVKSRRDLDVKAQVYVGLPHTIHQSTKHKFDVIIIDEAHHFYFRPKGMVQSIIKNSKPRFTLFLTGSPSKFIKQQYTLYAISLLELYELGRVCSPVVELAQSTYDYTLADYNNYQELRSCIQFSSTQTIETLDSLLTQIVRVLKSVDRAMPEARRAQVSIKWKDALRLLDKTMFVCRSQQQANLVRKYLEAAGVDVALSTSSFDEDSKEIERFKKDEKCMVLVVVNRGTLGFNMPELVNIVDMSGSLNADVLFQMFARLVRQHPNEKGKLFLKVVPEAMAEYVYVLMSFVIALAHKDIYETYGGAFRKARIAVPSVYVKCVQDAAVRTHARRPRLLKFDELPPLPRIEVMKSLFHNNGELLSSYAYTTLEEVCNRLKTPFLPFEEARAYIRSLGLGWQQWTEWRKSNRPNNIPRNPHVAYRNEWNGWRDFLGTGKVLPTDCVPFEEARAYARSLGVKGRREWKQLKRPSNFPCNPHVFYKVEWNGWGDFLGTENVPREGFMTFEQARAYVRPLGIKAHREWIEWKKLNRPKTLPSNPHLFYKAQWSGWGDFLGTGNVSHKDFLPFEEARAFARSLGLRARIEWRNLNRPNDIPSAPNIIYKEQWRSWGDFLGTAASYTADVRGRAR
jgi:superfamily II DNA or RNA helicase